MRKFICIFNLTFLLIVIITSVVFAQNIGMSKTGSSPDASAMLDVSADSLGILIPRVALNSIKDDTTITNPATSLLVYNTSFGGSLSTGFYYWADTVWVGINNLWKKNGSDIYYSEGNVGIGTNSPNYQFEVAREGSVANIVATTYRNGYSAGSITGRGARGTINEPMALLEGNFLAAFNARGYTGTKFTHIPPSGRIAFATNENWSDTAQGTNMMIYTTANGDTTSQERMRITADGLVGIGVPDPDNLLSVIGNSGAAHKPIAYFENTCDTVNGQLVDAFGIMGVCDQSDWAGYGVYGRGGFIGVRGRVTPTDTFSYYGGHFQAAGGAGENFGMEGYASGGGRNIGVRGRARSGQTNIGIYGQADTTGVHGTYAGYFEGDEIITGRLGVGLDNPAYKVQVLGNSGEPHTPIAYFENTCDTVNGQLIDAYGVMGICDQSDYAGYGGVFRGGYIGALGQVSPSDTFTYFGVRGIVNGGSGYNYALHGFAGGEGVNIGVRGRADGPNENYGIWGFASKGVSNYAVFGQADTSGVAGTYAGYFWGDTHISERLGIGIENAAYKLDVLGDINYSGILRYNGNPVSFTGDFANGGEDGFGDRFLGNTDNFALGFITNNTTKLHISNDGNIGIGTSSPATNLEVAKDQGVATITTTTYRNSGFSAGQYIGRAARGTMDTPSAVQADDALASFNGRGYGETGFSSLPRARLGIRAAENWTDASQGAYLTLETTPVGTIENTSERMRITSEGNIGIGITAPTVMLEVGGNAKADTMFANAFSSNSPLLLQTNKTTRIYVDDSLGTVGIGTETPEESAILDLTSSSQGFLPPRLSTNQIQAIASPVEGLVVYNSDTKKLNLYDGTQWSNMNGEKAYFVIGESYQGGIIAYILQPGDPGYDANLTHGFISWSTDLAVEPTWGCSGISIGTSATLGTGLSNTVSIVSGCATPGIAAQLCDELIEGSYDDWYLPSKDELNKLYLNKIEIGGFADAYYWSSTEDPADPETLAWGQYFLLGTGYYPNKGNTMKVRPIRSF